MGEGSSEGGGEPRTPGDRTPLKGRAPSLLQSREGAAARAAAALAGDSSEGGGALTLWFDQLVCGLGWLLRGDSERRSQLCFACFDVEGDGAVRREAFSSLLQGVYLLYEPPMHRQAAVRDARIAEVGAEAREFVSMMYDLWATPADGARADAGRGCDVLNAAQFRRAAHQHPLLVQARSPLRCMHGQCEACIHGACMVMHGVCMAYAWYMRGVCMVYAWYVHGICMAHDACMMHGACRPSSSPHSTPP